MAHEGVAVQAESGPLLLYQQHCRALIGQVLAKPSELGPPGPFIPLFYQMGLSPPIKKFAEVSVMLM